MADEELRPLGAGVINSLSDDNPPSRQFTYCTATFSRPKVLACPELLSSNLIEVSAETNVPTLYQEESKYIVELKKPTNLP